MRLRGFKPGKMVGRAEPPNGDGGGVAAGEEIQQVKWHRLPCIAEGQYGKVYLVKVADNDIICKAKLAAPHYAAAKVIQAVQGSQVHRKATRELDLLKKAAISPNIVKYLANSKSNGEITILLELMDLGSLERSMSCATQSGKCLDDVVRLNLVKAVGVQMLMGLLVLHEYLLASHRDVKAKNILVNSEGRVKLCDLDCGFDDAAEGRQRMDTGVGTEETMAPEIVRTQLLKCCSTGGSSNFSSEGIGSSEFAESDSNAHRATDEQPSYSKKCDIWSAGVVLYKVLVGKAPYTFTTVKDFFPNNRLWQSAIDFKAIKDDDMRDLLECMLRDNENERFCAMQCLQHKAFEELCHCKDVRSFDVKKSDALRSYGIEVSGGPASNLHSLHQLQRSNEIPLEAKEGLLTIMRNLLMERQKPAIIALNKILKDFNIRKIIDERAD